MLKRNSITILVWTGAILWSLLLILNGASVHMSFFKPLSTVCGVLSLVIMAFERWLWRLPLLHPLLVGVPDLNGTWKGELNSNWMNPETGAKPGPLPAYLVVRQTFSTIHATLLTNESESKLITGSVYDENDGAQLVAGLYTSTPRMSVRDRSSIHRGGLLLQILGQPAYGLSGSYWTDRETTGELSFDERTSDLYHDFARAAQGNYSGCAI